MGRLIKRRRVGAKRYDLLTELAKIMEPKGYDDAEIGAAYFVLSTMENGDLALEDGTLIAVLGGRICGVGRQITNP